MYKLLWSPYSLGELKVGEIATDLTTTNNKIRCFEVMCYEAFMKIQPKRHLFSDFFSHLFTFGIFFHPTLRWLCWIWLHRPLDRKQPTTTTNGNHPRTDGLDVGATEVEVDNWQFAWAEEQKKACCKTVGLGSPGKCSWKGDIGGVQIWMGGRMFLMEFFCGSFKKEETPVFFQKPFACWISFWTKLMEKGDVHLRMILSGWSAVATATSIA